MVWHPRKALVNLRKHGVAFTEAHTVFADDHALLLHDSAHSLAEDRYIMLGESSAHRLLVVVHTYRAEGNVIRVISARKANRQEREVYQDRRGR